MTEIKEKEMQTFTQLQTQLKSQIEYAPMVPADNEDLQGFWKNTRDGDLFLCSICSTRLFRRGFSLPNAVPCWKEEPRGVCASCGD